MEHYIRNVQAAASAVLLESKRSDLILTHEKLTKMKQLVSELEPLGKQTEYLASERFSSLSVVEPLVTAFCNKTLQPHR